MAGRLIRTIVVGLAIPALGFALAQMRLAGATDAAVDFFSFASEAENICAASADGVFGPGGRLCADTARLALLRDGSALAALVTVALLVLFFALARLAGANRARNAAIFPWLLPLSAWTVAALVLVSGAILTYSVALLLGLWPGLSPYVFWSILTIVGAGALFGGLAMIGALQGATREQPTGVLGRALVRAEAPELWAYVDELARALGSSRPDHLIVGLEPTFFATAAPVITPELARPLHGETLYLSMPLMRLFTPEELRAVVGHELGHFRGDDTDYSIRFAPLYRRLQSAILALAGEDGRADALATGPATAILGWMLETFALNERRISRDREHAADIAGASVANPKAVATSLAKVALFAPIWGKVRADNVARLSDGKIARNLSKVFVDAALYDVNHAAIGPYLAKVLEARIAHPTDSHPPIAERYAALGFDPRTLTLADLTLQGGAAVDLFPDLVRLEESLTMIEHRLMVVNGHARPPQGAKDDVVLNAAYVLAAAMARADGRIERIEVHTAEAIGAKLLVGFDAVAFRETLDRLDQAPPFHAAAELMRELLEREQLGALHRFLSEIAAADGAVDGREKELLDLAARRWGLVSSTIARRLLRRTA